MVQHCFKFCLLVCFSVKKSLGWIFSESAQICSLDIEVEFHLTKLVCHELLKVNKTKYDIAFNLSKDISNSFDISSPAHKLATLDAHTWAHILTGITQIYFIFWGRKKHLIGSLGNHPITYSGAQGRHHGRLSGKVSRNVCSERTAGPCRRTRCSSAVQLADTLHLTDTRRVLRASFKICQICQRTEADSLNKIT